MVEKNTHSLKSYIFVFIQFLSLILIGLTGPIFPRSAVLLLIELTGIFMGVWAVLTMRIGNFNITPDPLNWSKLVRSGPYRLIRHPMYLALLLTALPLVINHFSLIRMALWLILLVNLTLKMNYEEGLLSERLDGYSQYRGESYRMIPFLY
jgi:protein-S-isoprenylcysteine O-methyltransferase Ste14